jgi:site-specific DNA recombinase
MKKVGMYARVSSGRQEQERTIESQIAAIEQHIAARGEQIDPAHRYLDDGWSGGTLRRPGLDALRDAVVLGSLDSVVMYDADRLARRFVDQQVVLEELAQKGVEVAFVHGGAAHTPEEQMALGVRGIFAEYERVKILERTRRGMLYRARAGAPPAWPTPPYGYRYLRGERHQPGTVVIEACEAQVVQMIFTWVGEEGLRLRQVALRLEQRGIMTRAGKRWSVSTLGGLLRNSVYVGSAHHQKYEAIEPRHPRNRAGYRRRNKRSYRRRPKEQWIAVSVPPIVDRELFDKVQQHLWENKRRTAGQAKHPYLLRGLLVCAACSRTLWSYGCGAYRYYKCNSTDRHNARHTLRCPSHPLGADDVERVVWQDLARWLQEPEQLAAQLEAQRDKVRTVLDAYAAEQRRLAREAKTLEQAIQLLVDAYQEKAITLDELRARRERLEEAKRQCEERRVQAERNHQQVLAQRDVIDEVRQLKERLHHGLERCTWEDRRAIVELLVEKVEVAPPKLRVHYIVPLGTSGRETRAGRIPSESSKGTAKPNGGFYQPCPDGHAHAHGICPTNTNTRKP